MRILDLSERAARERATWQFRAIQNTRAHTTRLGCIVLAILGKSRHLPAFGPKAVITKDGLIVTSLTNKDGVRGGHIIGPVRETVEEFWRLADNLKLADNEREELIAALRKWIVADERVIQSWQFEQRGIKGNPAQ